jgi:hypothetical protein
MEDQPKLVGAAIEAWEHVAREFGDHDMDERGGWMPYTVMEPVDDAYYIGDWVPVEAICKEVVRLRAELAREQHNVSKCCPQSERLAGELAKAEASGDAKLRAYREWLLGERSLPFDETGRPVVTCHSPLNVLGSLTLMVLDRLLPEPAPECPETNEGECNHGSPLGHCQEPAPEAKAAEGK